MKKGFSLVELSIVLVILGLLTGGILAGQSLIRASELRAVSTEMQRYTSAVNTFRDKYFGLPGDITNATKFWTAQDAGDGLGTDCTDVASTTQATCNGDGNGTIGGGGNEMYRFWQQLANAGLIEGTYTGTQGSAGAPNANHHIAGTNSPRSKLGNAGWGTRTMNTGDFTAVYFLLDRRNTLQFGGPSTSLHVTPVLKPEEAWNIDTKMDDGRPGIGSVESNFPATCTNASGNTDAANANYALTLTAVGCTLLFKNPF